MAISSERVMNRKQLTILITKDRPDRLMVSVPAFAHGASDVIVIDDSTKETNREENRRLVEAHACTYHGPEEQHAMVDRMGLRCDDRFFGPLGRSSWTTGHNRNYALLLARVAGASVCLFSDDDVLTSPQVVAQVLQTCSRRQPFVGAHIEGMPDHSIVGHLYRAGFRLLQPQYVSGTFLAVYLDAVSNYYMNRYNEDWIWLCHETHGAGVDQVVRVAQMPYDPFLHWGNRLRFQEEGEILWEGTWSAFWHRNPDLLEKVSFWEDTIARRKSRIDALSDLYLNSERAALVQHIQGDLQEYYCHLSPSLFSAISRDYRANHSAWLSLCSRLSRSSGCR